MSNLFELRAPLKSRQRITLELGGLLVMALLWMGISTFGGVSPSILPSPIKVLASAPALHWEDALVKNLLYSCKLNVVGYMEALLVCIPLGFAVGLLPFMHGVFSRYIDAIRFLPITALTGLFIAWFGIEDTMKVQFLAFGISVYLLPVVVQRVLDLDMVYQHTAYTLGASKWQMIKTVFIPGVMPKLFDDIRVLTAISWTYIIVAELLNRTGGIGSMIYTAARQSRIDKVFALLLFIILVGYLQDKLLLTLDKWLFPHKYQGDGSK